MSWTEARTYLLSFLAAYYPLGYSPKLADQTWTSVQRVWETAGQPLAFEFFATFAKTRLIQAFVAKKLIRTGCRYYAVIDHVGMPDNFTEWFFDSDTVSGHARVCSLQYHAGSSLP